MSNSTPSLPPLLLRPQEAAEVLGISSRKLWGMTASGEIPCIRLGRCVRYSVDDLRLWIDAQKEGGDSQ
jgi:excisionase family DNA binding protein